MERYFCTAAHLMQGTAEERPKPAPGFVLHAKTMGTTRTVCGVDATAWMKYWQWPFPSIGTDLCAACRAEIAQRVRTQARSRDSAKSPNGTTSARSATKSRGTSVPVTTSTVRAGALDVAVERSGTPGGWPVVLLHGFPYDVRAYDQVAVPSKRRAPMSSSRTCAATALPVSSMRRRCA